MKEYETKPKRIIGLDQRILIISDLHFPYAHQDWHPFLKAIKEQYKPEIIISVGDEVDGHSVSFHNSESSLFNPDAELEKAIEEIHHLRDLFPKMYLCESNHGSLIYRRVKAENIPIRHIVPLDQLYETPNWSWHHEIMLETDCGFTTIVHGKTGGYNKLSNDQGCNAIQGHYHSKFELTWSQSSMGARYNMIVSCLIDQESMAYNYGKNFSKKPIHGVGWINEIGEPCLIRMKLDEHGRWHGKL